VQTLVRATWRDGAFEIEEHGEVRYVRARRASEVAAPAPKKEAAAQAPARRALRVV
jgi:hypothetical protein